MQQIGITTPHLWKGEASAIVSLLDTRLDTLHIRKPDASAEKVEHLMREIPQRYHPRLVLHNHHQLSNHFAWRAIHLNAAHTTPPFGYTGALTRGCHSIEELEGNERFLYSFLSPIFHSISKPGYRSAFTPEVLRDAAQRGIINAKVVALGGVTPAHFAVLESYGFGGAAMLGCLWNTTK